MAENSLCHGIAARMSTMTGKIKIQIKEVMHTYENGKKVASVCIDVIDNGIGIDEGRLNELKKVIANHDTVSQKHIGLTNVAQKIYLVFHDEQEFIINSIFGKQTHVRMIFRAIPAQNRVIGGRSMSVEH